jgi:hypothetical protein
MSELVASISRFGESNWQETPGGQMELLPQLSELRRRFAAGLPLAESHWRSILLEKGYVHSRAKWPAKEPFVVAFHLPALSQVMHVELVPRGKGLATLKASHVERGCGFYTEAQYSAEDRQVVGVLSLGKHTLEFEVVVLDPPWLPRRDEKAPPARISAGTVSLEVEAVENFDEVLPPADSEATNALVLERIQLCTDPGCHGTPRTALSFDSTGWPAEVGLSLDCALLQDGSRVESVALLFVPDPRQTRCCVPLLKLPRAVMSGGESKSPWSVRVRGATRGLAPQWQAKQRWTGEIVIPLEQIEIHGRR